MDGELGRRRDGGEGGAEEPAGAPNGVRSLVERRYTSPLARAIQRKRGDAGGAAAPTLHDAATAAVDHKGAGGAVDAGVAARVGSYLGADLGGVRVHSDPLSQEATAAMGARAFAYGGDVFLGPGESGGDLGLMAHELTHVVQQGAACQRAPQRQVTVGAADSPAEHQADAVSAAVTGGQPGAAASTALIVDELPVQPGQMLKSQFIAQLHGQVMAAAQDELGPIWSVMGCPYIEQTFARYSGQPAAASETLLKRFAPAAAQARTAADLIAPVVARVREGVRNWRETGQPPADVAAADERAAAGATDTPPRVQEQQMGPPAAAAAAPPAAQAKLTEPGSPAAMIETLGAGERLDGATASRMEGAFDHSFADVRIHTDATAARLADDHDAHAFTIGSHVAFGANAYRPGAPEGDALVAHELAHVVQQQGAGPVEQAVQRKPIEDGGAEAHADQAAHGVMAQLWGGVKGAARSVKDSFKSDLGMKRCSKTSAPAPTPALPTGSLTPSGPTTHTTGAQLDTFVSGSAAIGAYVRPQIAAGRVATGHVHFLSNADFGTRFMEYAQRMGMSEPDARAMLPGVEAYQDGTEVWVDQSRGEPATVVHEGMHLYESNQYDGQLGFNVSEGTTEWLMQMVVAEQGMAVVHPAYGSEVAAVRRMAAKGGNAAVMNAYFGGNIAGLRAAVDAATAAGTFDRWVTFMKAGQYAQANALM